MARTANRLPRCAVALLAAGFTLSLGVAAVLLPWVEQERRYNDEMEKRAERVGRYLELIDRLPSLEARLGEMRSNADIDTFYLKGSEPSLAGVELQRKVEGVAKATGGDLVSVQILPVQPLELVSKVGVRVRFSGLPDALGNLLYELETSKPLLFIDQLTVRAQRQGGRNVGNPALDKLIVNFDAYAYFRRGPG